MLVYRNVFILPLISSHPGKFGIFLERPISRNVKKKKKFRLFFFLFFEFAKFPPEIYEKYEARKSHFRKHKKFFNLGTRKFHFLKYKKIFGVDFFLYF